MEEYDKLVRDRIPEIVMEEGKEVQYRFAEDKEHIDALADKLVEEAKEFRETGSIEELADVLEVIEAIRKLRDYKESRIHSVKWVKYEEKGGFCDGVILEQIGSNDN